MRQLAVAPIDAHDIGCAARANHDATNACFGGWTRPSADERSRLLDVARHHGQAFVRRNCALIATPIPNWAYPVASRGMALRKRFTALALFGLARPRERHVEALAWLARLKRGLRESEVPTLVKWLRRTSHRKRIARMAAEWHDPEILAVLGEMFPIDPAILEPPRPGRGPMESVAIALAMFCFVALFVLIIHFVQVLHASHYVGDRAIRVSLWLVFCVLTTGVGALILKD